MSFKIEIANTYATREAAEMMAKILDMDHRRLEVKVVDTTPCDAEISHGPGHQSHSVCEERGEHEIHRVSGIPSLLGDAEWTDEQRDDQGRVFT